MEAMPTCALPSSLIFLRFPGAQSCCFVKVTQLESGERTQAGNREDSRTEKKPAERRASSSGSGSIPWGGGGDPKPGRVPPPATQGTRSPPCARGWRVAARIPPAHDPGEAICAKASYHTGPLVRTKTRNLGNEKRETGTRGAQGRSRRRQGLGHILVAARGPRTRARVCTGAAVCARGAKARA